MRTDGYGGRLLGKTIHVKTSDPVMKDIKLRISGHVDRFANISPDRIRLKGTGETPITAKVRIVPEKKYNFKITGATPRDGRNLTCSIKEIKGKNGREYELTVSNTTRTKGRYFDLIEVTTDSKVKPVIGIEVRGHILTENRNQSSTEFYE